MGAKTGIFDYYLNSENQSMRKYRRVKKLSQMKLVGYSDVNKSIGLEDFVEYLNIALNDDIEIKNRQKPPVTTNAVQLSTYYSAKGKEIRICLYADTSVT